MLLVANKYQTGFDQPLLCAMYVDKRLDGVQAVQALSRLNRTAPGKDAPFVLDFVNDAEDVFRAFKPYYDRTEVEAASDPARLEALKHEIDGAQVYVSDESFQGAAFPILAREIFDAVRARGAERDPLCHGGASHPKRDRQVANGRDRGVARWRRQGPAVSTRRGLRSARSACPTGR